MWQIDEWAGDSELRGREGGGQREAPGVSRQGRNTPRERVLRTSVQCPVGTPLSRGRDGGELVLYQVHLGSRNLARSALPLWSRLLCLLSKQSQCSAGGIF